MKCPKCNSENPDTQKFCGQCAAPLTAAEAAPSSFTKTLETPVGELTRGTLFADRYEIIEELGRGGMGSVYRVEDTKIGEEVALKLIKPEISHDKKTIERFSNELKLARKIIHKNVGRMFELMEDNGTHFIAMEYVPGQDLKGLIRQSAPISTARTISIAKQICAGLAEAHDMGVIHRDLKPSNIMIDKEGNARIMDFGIARSLKTKGITGAGVVIGTPEYMSPEQVEAKEVDRRSDIYSLGVILYEMVTGQVPFTGDTPFTIGVKHKSEIPKDPKILNTQIPADFCRVILTCLEKSKEKRFQSAGEVYSELENIENRIPSKERIVPKRKPLTSKEITVKVGLKKLFIPAFVVVVLLAVGGYYLFRGGSEPINIQIGSTQQITHAPGLELDPAISPDGKMIAYAAEQEGKMRLFIRQIAGGRTIPLTENFPGRHRCPQWSPDGTRIVFQSEGRVFLVPALGGIPKLLVQVPREDELNTPIWSPDSKQIAYGQGNAIYRTSVDGGELQKIAEAYDPHSLCWSHDGKHIAYVSGNSDFLFNRPSIGNIAPSSIWVVSTINGAAAQVTDNPNMNMSPVWTSDDRHLLFLSNRGGSRDLFQLVLDASATPQGPPIRLTTGLDAHSISISEDGTKLVYSVFIYNANIWSIRIPEKDAISTSEAKPVTEGNQAIEGISISPDGKWLAFDSNRSGNQDIFKMPVSGGELEQLTTHPSDDFIPRWSPDGDEIAFYSFRTGNRDIHLMTAEGGSIRQITDDPAQERYPDWSPDGNRLVFYSDKTGRHELYIISRNNKDSEWGAPVQLTFDGAYRCKWSPDGRYIVYYSSGSLKLIPPEGGDPRVLVSAADPATPADPIYPSWSPDGQTMYYKAIDAESRSSFWSIPVSGGTPKLLVRFDDPTLKSIRPEFTSDGFHLFFTITENRSDIWVMDLIL